MSKKAQQDAIPDNILESSAVLSRKDFIHKCVIIGGSLYLAGNTGLIACAKNEKSISCLVIDYMKCSGCRTCEAVCSSYNNPLPVNGKKLSGLGNPFLSNITIYPFSQAIHIPLVCAICPDAPCIDACPVDKDPKTGRKALYKNSSTGAVEVDTERCIACGKCHKACRAERTGVIRLNPDTGKPEGICSLCNGDPQCLEYCPYGAISLEVIDTAGEFYALPPEKIGKKIQSL